MPAPTEQKILPPATKKEIFGWSMYDVADSAFTTVIVTAFYAPYFAKVVVGDQGRGDLLWGLAAMVSEIAMALLAPILGAIADFSGSRKKFLGICAVVIVLFTAALYLPRPGMVWMAFGLYVIANIGFGGGGVFIDSFLPGISNESNAGRISGRKWAMGYLSGLVATVICLPLSKDIVFNPSEEQFSQARLIPLVVAAYYAIAVLPTFFLLRERSVRQELPPGESYLTVGFRQLKRTLGHIRQYRDLFTLMIAFFVYNDGVVTVIYCASLFASGTLQFTSEEFGVLLIVINVVAAAGAFLFGLLADKIGQKRTIFISLIVWIIAVSYAYVTTTKREFWVVAALVGVGLGSCQSVTRSLVAVFTPKQNAAEFFGFLGIAGKAGAFAGPATFGFLSWLLGDQRPAILSVAAFFIVGMMILSRVDEERGKKAALTPVEALANS
ncbi:MAG: MFS transporter [Blastocatellia bacterium]